MWKFRENSLDALRLFAAGQVAISHACDFMMPGLDSWIFKLIELFPGVPIFFFVSGLLISKSYENTPLIKEYAKNRILRLYPALIVCVAINIIMVASTTYLDNRNVSLADLFLLFTAKASFIQFYNPEFMRHFGDGVLNGSLWTICVELQFYIVTPLLYWLFSGPEKKLPNVVLIILICVFLAANRYLTYSLPEHGGSVWYKLFRVSFIPWFYMFLVGILFQRNFSAIAQYLSRTPAVAVLGAYILIAYFLVYKMGFQSGNYISPILFGLIIFVILRLAYVAPARVNNILRGNDISYGIYIWHMPVINQFLYLGYGGTFSNIVTTVAISILLAILSWIFIEKPALKLKKFTLNIRLKSA